MPVTIVNCRPNSNRITLAPVTRAHLNTVAQRATKRGPMTHFVPRPQMLPSVSQDHRCRKETSDTGVTHISSAKTTEQIRKLCIKSKLFVEELSMWMLTAFNLQESGRTSTLAV